MDRWRVSGDGANQTKKDGQKGLAVTDGESPSGRHLILRCLPPGVSHSGANPNSPVFITPLLFVSISLRCTLWKQSEGAITR